MNRRRWLRGAAWALACGWSGLGRTSPEPDTRGRARVLVAGGGFAGCACALELRRVRPDIEVTLIDPVSRYVCCPMSNAVIVGARAYSSLQIERDGLARHGVRNLASRVEHIDAQRRRVRIAGGATLAYDRLIVAPGIRFLSRRIQGYDEHAAQRMPHAWQAGEQTLRLAAQLQAMPEGGVVAITVPAGPMRCPPAPYERASLIAHYLQRHKPRAKLLIFDANNAFPQQPLFVDAWRRLYPGLIDWIPMTEHGAVERVDARSMTLFTAAGAHRVDVANVIPPQAPAALAPASGLAEEHGWCPVDARTFESTHLPGVHVIGDACIADAMPKAASAALSQALHCARAVAAALNGSPAPETTLDSICYAHVSPGAALAIPGRFTVSDGRIVPASSTDAPGGSRPSAAPAPATVLDQGAAAVAALDAERWFAALRAQAFAA